MADGNRRYKSDKKVYKVSFKLSETELLKLESDAKKAGKNRSEYLRELVKNSKGVDTTFASDRSSFIRQITGIATNVNQIAKVVNTQSFAYSSDITGLKRDLEEIKRLMQEVLSVWQSLRYCT
ncbi:MAG: MobC family plasmid mobilization relaxosome protein [Lachnospiraceae bacterium]|nr:MobC family plasmid mobilization relaxosome protein [Lachnospiraceae bacterium]